MKAPLSEPATTLRSIAKVLGVSAMTVSRALRNAPRIAPETRRRVLEAAKRLDYRPDPALTALSAYRTGLRKPRAAEPILFLTNYPTPDHWRSRHTFRRYHCGAESRAAQLGYRVEPFWLGDSGLTPKRASRIMEARGIRGVLVGPMVQGDTSLHLNWERFSAVSLGRSLAKPGLTTVSTNHAQGVELAWREIWSRGYRRIGLALTEPEDTRTMGTLRASFLLQQSRDSAPPIPIFRGSEQSAKEITTWVRLHNVEVLLSHEPGFYDVLPIRTRRKLGFIHLNVPPGSGLAGIDQGHDLVGESAMALLHIKLIQNETGVPERRDILMIEGVWVEGTLFPPVAGQPGFL